jgi:hypothetical protein
MTSTDKFESLNNLVGGTSNLLELKLGIKNPHKKSSTTSLQSFYSQSVSMNEQPLSPSKINMSTNLKTIDELNQNVTFNHQNDDLQLIDVTKDRKELEAEFDQAFKRMNRVKDNYSTHKKFMDIVKSKSMKALNRKSSATSLQHNDATIDARGSMPPDHKSTYGTTPRAKSVSKEPGIRDNLKQSSSSGLTSSTSSVFSSLSRRIAKIRFSSSSQPPPPIKPPVPDQQEYDNLSENSATGLKPMQKSKSQIIPQVQVNDVITESGLESGDEENKKSGKSIRDRALSPSKFLKSLRPRSPFGRSSRSSKSSTPTTTTTMMVPGGKSFTITNNSQSFDSPDVTSRTKILQNDSYQSESFNSQGSDTSLVNTNNRYVRATSSNGPSLLNVANLLSGSSSDKLRSLSCEFIDDGSSPKLYSASNMFKNKLNETLDEYDESVDNNSNVTGSSYTNIKKESTPQQQSPALNTKTSGSNSVTSSTKKLNLVGITNPSGLSRVEQLKKNFLENTSNGSTTEIVKSVKFKDPPEKSNDSQNTNSIERPPKHPAQTTNNTTTSTTNSSGSSSITNLTSTFNFRSKFSSSKAKTIDLPEQSSTSTNKYDSSNNSQIKSSTSITNNITNSSTNNYTSNSYLSPTLNKPLQSILRRSETPPSSKINLRQQNSIESNESNQRETSIEKMLRSTSTSRPLMFNN